MTVRPLRQGWAADGWRFALAGTANTLITLAIYQILLFFVPAWLAYAISWLAGFLFVVIFYPSRVFAGARRDTAARLGLGAAYLLVFLLGLGVLKLAVAMGMPPRVAIFGVMAATTSANFVFGRWLLATRVSGKVL